MPDALSLRRTATSSTPLRFFSLAELRGRRFHVMSTQPPLSLLPIVAPVTPMPVVTHDTRGIEHIVPRSRFAARTPHVEMRQKILSYLEAPRAAPSYDIAGNPIVDPTDDAVREALCFLDSLPQRLRPPHIGAADDGEINFSWTGDGVFIDVGFRGDGHLHYHAKVESEAINGGGDEQFPSPALPRDLEAALVSMLT